MRKTILVAAAVVALSLAAAGPAMAAPGDSGATFSLTGGALSISVPAGSASLGTQATGTTVSTISGPLGTVQVTDARGLLLTAWTASVASTPFTTGAKTANETIASSAVTYQPGLATATSGTAVFLPGLGGAMTTQQTAFSASAAVGNNSASWNPTVSVAVPAQAVVGTYSAVITHSVA